MRRASFRLALVMAVVALLAWGGYKAYTCRSCGGGGDGRCTKQPAVEAPAAGHGATSGAEAAK